MKKAFNSVALSTKYLFLRVRSLLLAPCSFRPQPHAFHLLPCSLLFALCSLLFSCSSNPNIQGRGETILQGIWKQDSIQHASDLLSYTQHQFRFSCDSFYVDLTTYSKVNYYEDECFNNGVWKEYAKGTYTVKGDTLFLTGTFTKANYKQKLSGCYRNGQYLYNFKIKEAGGEKLILEGLNDRKEYALSLKEKIICVPKPL